MMASMGPTLPSTGSVSINLVDNHYHGELAILYFGRGGRGRKKPRYDSVGSVPRTKFGESKKN
jgi:hypothetical protein